MSEINIYKGKPNNPKRENRFYRWWYNDFVPWIKKKLKGGDAAADAELEKKQLEAEILKEKLKQAKLKTESDAYDVLDKHMETSQKAQEFMEEENISDESKRYLTRRISQMEQEKLDAMDENMTKKEFQKQLAEKIENAKALKAKFEILDVSEDDPKTQAEYFKKIADREDQEEIEFKASDPMSRG